MWRAVLGRKYSNFVVTARRSVYNNLNDLNDVHELFFPPKSSFYKSKEKKAARCALALETLERVLSSDNADERHTTVMTRIVSRMAVTDTYDESSFDNFSKYLVTTSKEIAMQKVLPAFLALCTKTRYYNFPLLQKCSSYIGENISNFDGIQLLRVIWSLGQMRFSCPAIANGIEDFLLSENKYQQWHDLSWMLAWYGMINRQYPTRLLQLILTDSYINEYVKAKPSSRLSILFQLKIALNLDCPNLDLSTGWDNQDNMKCWGVCRSGIKNISDATIQKAYEDLVTKTTSNKRSIFHSNVWRALRSVLGSSVCIQGECLSLSGYSYDFEIMFDKHGNPLQVPRQWKSRSETLVTGSISRLKKKKARNSKFEVDDVLNCIKEGEKGTLLTPTKNCEHLENVENYIESQKINLASDWGTKFVYTPRVLHHKVVIEANGERHYARNIDHTLGYTYLKEQQTELLGWKMISINYRDWQGLATGDDHALRMKRLLQPYYHSH